MYVNPNFNSQCLTEAVKGEFCKIISIKEEWLKLSLEDGYVGWAHKFYGKRENKKKLYPYKVVYPHKNRLFHPNYPFGSQVQKRIKGAVNIDANLSLNIIDKIIENLLDIPYKWGGKTSLGFDCSGLVQSVLNVLGLLIPRDSSDQYKFFNDSKIDMKDAKYGDLHFFGTKEK